MHIYIYIYIGTLTRCGAPNKRKTDPNCVANGVVHANEQVGARDGIGYIDKQL